MEKVIKTIMSNKKIIINVILGFLCLFLILFNLNLFHYADLPFDDEAKIIGKVYNGGRYSSSFLYFIFLKCLSVFSSNPIQFFKLNFQLVHLLLPLSFFFYNLKKKGWFLSFSFSMFLFLNPLNLVTTRLIILWEIILFYFSLWLFERDSFFKRKMFKGIWFLLLAFFRFEFIFLSIIKFFEEWKVEKKLKVASFCAFAIIFYLLVKIIRPDLLQIFKPEEVFNNFILYITIFWQSFYNTIYNFPYLILIVLYILYSLLFSKVYKVHLKFDQYDSLLLALIAIFILVKYQQHYSILLFYFFTQLKINKYHYEKRENLGSIFEIVLLLICTIGVLISSQVTFNFKHYPTSHSNKGQNNIKIVEVLSKMKAQNIYLYYDKEISPFVLNKNVIYIKEINSKYCVTNNANLVIVSERNNMNVGCPLIKNLILDDHKELFIY